MAGPDIGADRTTSDTGGSQSARLSIGALARATDVPVATLRTWERRYGYPVPERKPSGHRVYPVSSVPHLRRIAEALDRGYRAAEVVPASESQLTELLGAIRTAPAPAAIESIDTEEPMRAIERFDAQALTRMLTTEWGRLGPLEFLQGRIAPLLREVGEAWADGRLEVAHEHFLSERVGDLLRSLRLPFEERAQGPLVVMATLPGETHTLGLQMAALVLAVAGCSVCNLGGDVPVEQLVAHAKSLNARAVGISVSAAHRDRRTGAHLRQLSERLPRRIALFAGGDGAPSPREGLQVMSDLEALHLWAVGLAEQAT